jgi:hypothetical protein
MAVSQDEVTCLLCGYPLDGEIGFCNHCRTPYHRACFFSQDMGRGHCATLGCPGNASNFRSGFLDGPNIPHLPEQHSPLRQPPSTFSIQRMVIVGVILLILFLVIWGQLGETFSGLNLSNETEYIFVREIETATQEIMENTQIFDINSTPLPIQTGINCPESIDQRIEVGKNALVCLNSGRLNVRNNPGLDGSVITSLTRGTNVKVIDGPKCLDYYSWWKIISVNGIEGWVAEGDQSTGLYFICPEDNVPTITEVPTEIAVVNPKQISE